MKQQFRLIPLMLIAASFLAGCSSHATPPEKDNDPEGIFRESLRSVSKLTLGRMTLTKTAAIDDAKMSEATTVRQKMAALTDLFKLGDRTAVYSYDSYMEAYVDLSSMQPTDVTMSADSVLHVALPPLKLDVVGRDATVREEHYRVTGLRSQVNADERAALKEAMASSLRADLEADPAYREILIRQAKANGIRFFESLGAYSGLKVEVEFND